MADILAPDVIEAIRENNARPVYATRDVAYANDIAALLADHDALTARAEAAERKVAAVRELLRTSVQTVPSGFAVYEMVDADEIAHALDGEAD